MQQHNIYLASKNYKVFLKRKQFKDNQIPERPPTVTTHYQFFLILYYSRLFFQSFSQPTSHSSLKHPRFTKYIGTLPKTHTHTLAYVGTICRASARCARTHKTRATVTDAMCTLAEHYLFFHQVCAGPRKETRSCVCVCAAKCVELRARAPSI